MIIPKGEQYNRNQVIICYFGYSLTICVHEDGKVEELFAILSLAAAPQATVYRGHRWTAGKMLS